jgi:signal transduction histidine kinase
VGVPGEVLGGSGVENMTRRAASLGGSFELEALPAGGSSLTWRVPRHANRERGLGADDLIDH